MADVERRVEIKEMRKVIRVLVIGFIILICAPVSRNDVNTRRDGNWWRDLTKVERLTYVTGFFDGMNLGNEFSYWGIVDKDKQDSAAGKAVASYGDYGDKYLKHVTNSQVADGLDTFFSDYRNRRIETSNAVWLVLNEISGTSDAEMQRMIESWRKNASQ
jgi:hypothetical protein